MKKTAIAMTVLACAAAHAGTMGPVSTPPAFIPYATGEASYTWPGLGQLVVNNTALGITKQGWGGRLGLGALHFINDNLGFTGEIGGGYYGSFKGSLSTAGVPYYSMHTKIDGYDVLAGALYRFDHLYGIDQIYGLSGATGSVDLFGEAGFMVENNRFQEILNNGVASSIIQPSMTTSGVTNLRSNNAQAYPEIKVGGIYNFNSNWGLSVAYMHVFGTQPYAFATATPTSFNASANGEVTTLNSVMFGLRYYVV